MSRLSSVFLNPHAEPWLFPALSCYTLNSKSTIETSETTSSINNQLNEIKITSIRAPSNPAATLGFSAKKRLNPEMKNIDYSVNEVTSPLGTTSISWGWSSVLNTVISFSDLLVRILLLYFRWDLWRSSQLREIKS